MIKGLLAGIGMGIGIMVAKEAKRAYDRHMLEQKIKGLWSDIKKAYNEAAEETN
jgi:hypothetical protein